MAKVKADWLKEAKALGLTVTPKNTIGELKEMIQAAEGKTQSSEPEREAAVAKAGKRSAKATTTEEKKATKKNEADKSTAKKRGPVPVTKPRIARRSKGYRAAHEKLGGTKQADLAEAIRLITESAFVKFDSAIELHVRLAVDPKKADQNIRDTIVLPSGSGKTLRVGVVASSEDQAKAKQAGADLVGDDELLEEIKAGKLDFDILIATPKSMPKLGQLARILGPKGLMPNPKSGTVTADVATAVSEAKTGKIEYRVDPQSIIHCSIGKASFGADKLLKNAEALISSIKSNKPASVKDNFILSIYLTSSMGPSVRVNH